MQVEVFPQNGERQSWGDGLYQTTKVTSESSVKV